MKYFRLKTSDNLHDYRFVVMFGGYAPKMRKAGSEEDTIGGGLDVCQGKVRREWTFGVRVFDVETEIGYGTKSDLEYLFGLNNPAGTPSNRLTMIDHFGEEYHVCLVGELAPNPLTTIITGTNAIYIMQIRMVEVE